MSDETISQATTGQGAEAIQPWPVVKKGAVNHPVQTLQYLLRARGIFGPQTDGFVRGFQSALGVTADGIVGPITWRALVAGQLAG